jgi:hypothetical protein
MKLIYKTLAVISTSVTISISSLFANPSMDNEDTNKSAPTNLRPVSQRGESTPGSWDEIWQVFRRYQEQNKQMTQTIENWQKQSDQAFEHWQSGNDKLLRKMQSAIKNSKNQ